MADMKFSRPRTIQKARPNTRPNTRIRAQNAARSCANIRVVVRVRPPNTKEQGANSRIIIKVVDEKILVFDPKEDVQSFFYHGVEQKTRDLLRKPNKDMLYTFDRVFGFESTNEEIFESTTKSLIQSLMEGYNCSVFAYGATGAGKTHTMLGHNRNPGITYLTMAELFKVQKELNAERRFEMDITYLEVYNELVQDLLNPGKPLQLREDPNFGVIVAGIKVHRISEPEQLFRLLEQGDANRTQHPTDANLESSRSHAVFQVYIKMEFKTSCEVRRVKLSMIDLAGSERGSATKFSGMRFTEGANINKSLLALGNCINSLSEGQKYVAYRDSKLTRLLKDSLGGNCQTVMIANVSPSSLSIEDTHNTLKYATRAKKIKAEVHRNTVDVELHAGEYLKIINDQKKEIELLKTKLKEQQETNVVLVKSPRVNSPRNCKRLLSANIPIRQVTPVAAAASPLEKDLKELVGNRKRLLDRMHNIELTGGLVALRRNLKEDADERFCVLHTVSPLMRDAHSRLGNTINRFHRQEERLDAELKEIKATKAALESRMQSLIDRYPDAETKIRLEDNKLCLTESQNQIQVIQKKCAYLEDEIRNRSNIMGRICEMLKSCYLQLCGHGFATESLKRDYKSLLSDLEGRRHITWEEDAADSGMSSSTSSSLTDQENHPLIDVVLNGNNNGTDNLNETFVLGGTTSNASVQACAQEIIIKDSTMNIKSNLARRQPLKENKVISNITGAKKSVFKRPKIDSANKKPPFKL